MYDACEFNMPNILFGQILASIQSTKCTIFINFVINNDLSQLVYKPTRGSNILDLVLCNDNLAVLDLECTHLFSTSDHVCLAWSSWFPLSDNVRESAHISICLLILQKQTIIN